MNTKINKDAVDFGHFEQVAADPCFAGNALLDEFTRLIQHCRLQAVRIDKQSSEIEQYKTQLVNMVRSLDLASRVDAMTGLANRRDIMEKIDREATRALRHKSTFTVLLINVDNFKRVNELYGYNAGDDVLVEIARVLRGCVRNEDICGRWGGEEFIMLLPETAAEASLAVANKVLECISMTEFKANKPGIRVTVSIGICEHDPEKPTQECISGAVQALALAKQAGKNRYIISR